MLDEKIKNNNSIMRSIDSAAESAAEHSLIKLASRAILIILFPLTAFFASESYEKMDDIADRQISIEKTQIEIVTSIKDGILPRISTLEGEVSDVQKEAKEFAKNSYTRSEGVEINKRLRYIETEVNRLKVLLAEFKTRFDK